jgi:hypothetical protein
VGPQFHTLAGWDLTPPEFAPYLLASGPLKPGQRLGIAQRRIDNVELSLEGRVESEEELSVPAGRFHVVKIVLKALPPTRARGSVQSGTLSAEEVVWYAPQVKRVVKSMITTRIDNVVREATTFELTAFRVH